MKYSLAIIFIGTLLLNVSSGFHSNLLQELMEREELLSKRGSNDMGGLEASIACEWMLKGLTGSTANAASFCNAPMNPRTSDIKILKNIKNLEKLCYAACRADRNTGICVDRCDVSRSFTLGKN
ncbi:DgyrCDS14825 [Dimorphilus gyrociliatus]|uniref:DgyrCDS14825 n=1 Tax=Dimorphilus gyrociliatus TaxID=2664684 RepID=A0A7I8WFA7_9ANNE|nr:DgyrCDS14825 [Dimorphilus gyrociliatus]